MKEFDGEFVNIFGGLNPERAYKKKNPMLEECHNIEPLKEDYAIHEIILDLNATGQDWSNTQDLVDYWTDNEDDDWTDDTDDEFTDI